MLTNPTTILDAIAMAGGFRDFAKQKDVYVLRRAADGNQTRLPFNYKRRRQRAQCRTEHSPAVERYDRRSLRWHVKRHILFIAISAALLLTFGWGQDGHTVPASALGPELPYTEVLTPPPPVNTVQMPLLFSSDGERSNILSGSIQLGSGYDDNALVTPSDHISNVSVLVLPRIEIRQNRERWSLDLSYSPGIRSIRTWVNRANSRTALAFQPITVSART